MSGEYTKGPWAWFGNGKASIYLATVHSGRRIVMDFVRKGTGNAQPRFQPPGGLMVKSNDLLLFEVGDPNVKGMTEAKSDESVYRYDIRGIDNADARLIAAAPELLEALEGVVASMEAYSAEYKPSAEWDEYDLMMFPRWKKAFEAIKKAKGEA